MQKWLLRLFSARFFENQAILLSFSVHCPLVVVVADSANAD